MSTTQLNFALFYAGDAYSTEQKIMGRQSAGQSLLRGVAHYAPNAVVGGLGLQAFVITLSVTGAMLLVYRAGLIKANGTFVAVLSTLTIGIGLMYLAQFILGFFDISIPGLGLQSAMQGGNGAWIGLAINGAILLIASLWLIVDFQQVEAAVATRVGKEYEWYFAYGLMVTLVWIYLEALKLAFRMAMMANERK